MTTAMADVEFPNTEELEELKGGGFTRTVALVTAVYAVILAISSVGGSNATKETILAQQQASDQWAFYQAKVQRAHVDRNHRTALELAVAERGDTMRPDARSKLAAAITELADEERRYQGESKAIEERAREFERVRDENRKRDPYFDEGEMFLQIAIVMSSVSILSTSRRLFSLSVVLAVIGSLLTLNGFASLLDLPFVG